MKDIKKAIKIFTIVLSFAVTVVFGLVIYGEAKLPDTMNIVSSRVVFSNIYTMSKEPDTVFAVSSTNGSNEKMQTSEIKLFGLFPVKDVNIDLSDRRYVALGGEIIGIRLETQGVLVVGFDSFECDGKTVSPAQQSGIIIGDSIISLDGKEITNNESFSEIIENSDGREMNLTVLRNGKTLNLTIKPEKSSLTGIYKGGLWIRDCTGGIGTLTFADISKGTLASLGHGIYDVDTGSLMQSEDGYFGDALLSGISKGNNGYAGELKGCIGTDNYGQVLINSENGVYGTLTHYNKTVELIPVAFPEEIKTGKAQIVSTVDSNGKKYYDIEIEKVDVTAENKNFIIKVTDDELIEATGGIVQGMSGSPIVQDGKLVGAVTHVFLNDPTKGYGILAQTMLEFADNSIEEFTQNNAA